MITCLWLTVAEWAILVAQPESIFDGAVARGGPTYTRICADGTVWINETLALTYSGALP